MHFYYTPYIWFLLASAGIVAALVVHAWHQRIVPGAKPLLAILAAIVLWNLANALEITGLELPTKIFWANVQYLSFVVLPVAGLAMVLEYTGRGRWLRGNLPWLVIIPALTMLFVWTNGLHGLMRQRVYLYQAGPLILVGKTYGPWFWVHTAYSYLLLLGSVFLLLRSFSQVCSIFRWQSLILLGGLLLPVAGNLIYLTRLGPDLRLDLTPIIFGLSGLLTAWGLLRFRLFDLVPVARTAVIENMDDGVIVLDMRRRIQDLNPAALRILGWMPGESIGRQAEEVFGPWPELAAISQGKAERGDLELGPAEQRRSYELHASLLPGLRDRSGGRIVILHDATVQKETQLRLVLQQRTLAALEEREHLARELHDSVAQVLGFVNLRTQTARDLLAGGRTAETDSILGRLAEVALEAQGEVRGFMRRLKDRAAAGDFLVGLQELLRQFERDHGIVTDLQAARDFTDRIFVPETRAQVLRIVQEILTNIWRHAEADCVHVSLVVREAEAQVIVEDNGRGFDPGHVKVVGEGGLGLGIMRERAREAGGALEVHSQPGLGTRVVVRMPLCSGSQGGGLPHEGAPGG